MSSVRTRIFRQGGNALGQYIALKLPKVPGSRRSAIAAAARSAASVQGGSASQIIDALAGCTAWWYADTASAFQDTGGTPAGLNDPVGQLNDWVGSYNGTQATSASKPTLTADGLYLDGGDSLSIASGSAGGSGDCTMLAIGKTVAGDTSNGVMIGYYPDSHILGMGQVFFREADSNARSAATGAFTQGQFYLASGYYKNGINCGHRRGNTSYVTGAVATGIGRAITTSGSIGGANTSAGPPPSMFLTGYWKTGLITPSTDSSIINKLSQFLSNLTGLGVF